MLHCRSYHWAISGENVTLRSVFGVSATCDPGAETSASESGNGVSAEPVTGIISKPSF